MYMLRIVKEGLRNMQKKIGAPATIIHNVSAITAT
jgi:hypothetical protein